MFAAVSYTLFTSFSFLLFLLRIRIRISVFIMRFSTIAAFMLPLLTALAVPITDENQDYTDGLQAEIADAIGFLKDGVHLGLGSSNAKDALDILQSDEFKFWLVDIGTQLNAGLDPRIPYADTPCVVTIVDHHR